MDSDSIYDQHKMTALMFDRKNKVQELKQQVTFPSQRHRCSSDATISFRSLSRRINLEFGQVLQLQANRREFCLLCTVKCTIYMWKIKRRKNKTKQPDYKNGKQLFVHHEKVYNLQMKTSTKTLYRPQFGFSASRKKKEKRIGKHYFSPQS